MVWLCCKTWGGVDGLVYDEKKEEEEEVEEVGRCVREKEQTR